MVWQGKLRWDSKEKGGSDGQLSGELWEMIPQERRVGDGKELAAEDANHRAQWLTSHSIQTWALEEARRRLEAEGILADPDVKKD